MDIICGIFISGWYAENLRATESVIRMDKMGKPERTSPFVTSIRLCHTHFYMVFLKTKMVNQVGQPVKIS